MIHTIQSKPLRVWAVVALVSLATSAQASPVVGKQAPAFVGKDSRGETRSLDQLKGKYVVLEWLNHGCPYVKKHYDTNNMQKLQKQWTDKGVVWLSIVSSAEGKQGFQTADETNATAKEKGSHATAIVLDQDGTIGKAYGARTTPQMFVVDPRGVLVYAGAIDDKPSTDTEDVAGAKNFVSAALTAAMAGEQVDVTTSRPYGCSVKY